MLVAFYAGNTFDTAVIWVSYVSGVTYKARPNGYVEIGIPILFSVLKRHFTSSPVQGKDKAGHALMVSFCC
jgi:hypothetical protein